MARMTSASLLLLVSGAAAAKPEPQLNVRNESPAFTEAANALINSYVPISLLTAPVAAAAAAASVTGDVASLITSALEATPVPAWFYGAVPAEYKTNIDAVISGIDALRATVTAVAGQAPTATATVTVTNSGSGASGMSSVTNAMGSSSVSGGATGSVTAAPTVEQTVVVETRTDSTGGVFTTSFPSAIIVTSSAATNTDAQGSTTTAAPASSGETTAEGGASNTANASASTTSQSTNFAAIATPAPGKVLAGAAALVAMLAAV